ncbi:Lreu_0056 family protein [Limosilactobacillus antri]|uniref:Lreu_0056 family protein n=1 Tax=Limosilactobacillus antri TaxID=227943 RepID=UPI001F5851C9|nr:hypothetical protein [Limosilactobacillus antri]
MRKIKLVILSITLLLALNLPPVGADSRPLTDQQLGILVGLAVDSHWVRQESASQSLVYGIVTPADQVPVGVSRDDSYLVARDGDAPTVVYYRLGGQQVYVSYPAAGKHHLRTVKFTVRQLRHRFFRTAAQRRQVNALVSKLQTE